MSVQDLITEFRSDDNKNHNKGDETTKTDDVIDGIEKDDKMVDTRFGFGRFKPRALQRLATVRSFTTFYSIASLMMSTLTVYINSQITTLERQFGFSSKQTGLIMAANDIGYLICVLFVAHSANMLHIPRSLGMAVIGFGVSGLVCSLPHFIYGSNFLDSGLGDNSTSLGNTTFMPSPMKVSQDVRTNNSLFGQLCSFDERPEAICTTKGDNSGNTHTLSGQKALVSLVIIVIGMVLQGFAKAPRATFSLVYIDGNTRRVKTGLYMGIMISVSIVGPAVAFLVGGVFSRIYVTLGETDLYPKHPKWIGAWWLGFLFFGGISIIVSLPLFCFPKKLPRKNIKPRTSHKIYKGSHRGNGDVENAEQELVLSEKEPSINKNDNTHLDGGDTKNNQLTAGHINTSNRAKYEKNGKANLSFYKSFLLEAKLFFYSLYRLFTNPIYVLIDVSVCFVIFTVAGSSAFSPKYLERVFDFPAYQANYIIAGQTLATACVGSLLGGVLTHRFKMTAKISLMFTGTVVIISVVFSFLSLFVYCDQPTIYNRPGSVPDSTLPSAQFTNSTTPGSSCNLNCHCQDETYFPICGGDGKTYYSPCMAGCPNHQSEVYSNCSCIEGGTATIGICPYGCYHVYLYVIFSGLRGLLGTIGIAPKYTTIIRIVDERDKSLALGVGSFLASLLGWMLGPVLFGAIVDGICDIWDQNCGVTGRCLLYDNNLFRLKFNGFGLLGVSGSAVCLSLAMAYAWWTKCLDGIDVEGRRVGKDEEKQEGKEEEGFER